MSKMSIVGKIRQIKKDSLLENSIFIGMSRFSDVGFGFFFWFIAARLYTVEDVGTATVLISAVGLMMALSRLGLDTSQIRFGETYDRGRLFSTCLWIPLVFTVIFSGLYFSVIGFTNSALSSMITPRNIFIFILITIFQSISLTSSYAFMSMRDSKFRFLQNLLSGTRIPFLFIFFTFGTLGILLSFGLAYAVTSIVSLYLINKVIKIRLGIDKTILKSIFRFSFFNYVGNVLIFVPTMIIPMLILNILGAASAALYYIAFSVGNVVLIIPDAVSTSFFVEGSHETDIRTIGMKSLKIILVSLSPAVLLISIFGGQILGLFGKSYVPAYGLLIVIVLSSYFVAIFQMFYSFLRIEVRADLLVLISLMRMVILICTSYLFISYFGLIGAGFAWLTSYLVLCILIVVILMKLKWGARNVTETA